MWPVKRESNPSELQIALDNRAFEIQLFWQRSNYFLVLMTALGIGVFTIKDTKYAFLISVFATITSWFWYKTNLGSKFWHESWEVEVVALAKEQGIRSFERPTSEIVNQVRQSLEEAHNAGYRSMVRRWLDMKILEKPSVSHYMILLSLTSALLWGSISIFHAVDLVKASGLKFSISRMTDPPQAAPASEKPVAASAHKGRVSGQVVKP